MSDRGGDVMTHVCNTSCDVLAVRGAHERSCLRRRAAVAAKLKSRRPKVRWLGGHPPPQHWVNEAWRAVWG